MMSPQEPIVSLEHTLKYFGELPSLYHFRLYGTTDRDTGGGCDDRAQRGLITILQTSAGLVSLKPRTHFAPSIQQVVDTLSATTLSPLRTVPTLLRASPFGE